MNAGLVRFVSDNPNRTIKNYRGFTFYPNVSRKYEDRLGRWTRIHGITFRDRSGSVDNLSIYVAYGLVCGYAFERNFDFKPVLGTADVSGYRIAYLDSSVNEVEKLLPESVHELVNWSDVFDVEISGIKYWHLLDLEDGDFVGIDESGVPYEFRHDPLEINPSNISLEETIREIRSSR